MGKTIGLCMIVKDEIDEIKRIYADYGRHFDRLFITVTSLDKLEEFHKFATEVNMKSVGHIVISTYAWDKNFSNARNFNFNTADTDYIFWMDADDDLIHGHELRQIAELEPDVDMFRMTYIYAKDEVGNPIMVHPRERLIKNNKKLVWKGRVHETLIPYENCKVEYMFVPSIQLVHRAGIDHNTRSMERNIEIMLNELKENGDKTDPRTLSYLATGFVALNRFEDAIKFYEKHIQVSGWTEDIYLSWVGIAQCLRSLFVRSADKKLLETAISADNEAALLLPNSPDAYLGLGETYVHMKAWDKVIEWTHVGLTKRPNPDMPYTDPTRYTIRPLTSLAYAYLGLNNIDKAYECICKAKAVNPKASYIVEGFDFFKLLKEDNDLFKNLISIASYLKEHDRNALKHIDKLIPANLAHDDRFIRLANEFKEPKMWDKNTVVIFCGTTPEEWAAPSVLRGIGGSEEAAIYLSKELTQLGYKVTIFNSCGDMEGEYDGVTYKNWYHFNPNDSFDTLIGWRGNIFNMGITANKKLCWLHDVPFTDEYTAETTKNVDKVIVLSNYHKTLLKDVPENKLYVSTNGLNIADLIKTDAENIERNHRRIIYGSSYDRGLENLLDMWPDVRKDVPDAELHVFYGWTSFDNLRGVKPELVRWKEQMIEKLKQPGVFEHGRVGHKQLLKEFAKSGIWAYPTEFAEINCITGLKAQAMGCLPIYNNVYALQDTVKFGAGINATDRNAMLSKYKDALIKALQMSRPHFLDANKEEIRESYSWQKIAQEWSRDLFPLSCQPSSVTTSNSVAQSAA